MKKRLVRFLAWIGGLVLALLALSIVASLVLSSLHRRVPERSILELDLERGLVEDVPADPVAQALLGRKPTLRETLDALERAAGDGRVAGALVRVGGGTLSMAQAEELRDALVSFRGAGKFALAFAETFGEFGDGARGYLVATACDEIWLQPSGDLGLAGIVIENPFVRGLLDKLQVKPQLDHRKEYKNAMNLFTERGYTAAHREANQKVLDSLYGQLVRGIAGGRRLPEAEVRALVDRGPLLAKEARDARLVDRLGYRQEAYDRARERAGKGASFLYGHSYLERAGRPHAKGPRIALIYGVGAVARGESGYNPLLGQAEMGSDTVAGALRAAIADPAVKAILFRIDSPGGSYVGSDVIWHEVMRARQAGKPVVASMSSVAGSGGYFVAMAADKIVAQPGTITASIGVLAGKMVTRGLLEQIGVTQDRVTAGANATTWLTSTEYTPAEWARLQAALDRIYEDFTSKVAAGRKLPKEKVLEIAKGRIWTGEDAKALGLVDELGGYARALGLAKQLAGIGAGEEVELRLYPPRKELGEVILDRLSGREPDSSEPEVSPTLVRLVERLQPAARALEVLEGASGDEVLRMPPGGVR